ncbi:MAG: hypothetical protein ACQES9_05380 [Myxococcota bacterium]
MSIMNVVKQNFPRLYEQNKQKSSSKKAKKSGIEQMGVKKPENTEMEKGLDKCNFLMSMITQEPMIGTLMAPASILGGLYALGRAQNVKGREANFKAMAMDAAVDYLSLGGGRVMPLKDFPTPVQAAVGQGCLGQRAPLNSSFHNARERGIFNHQYKKTLKLIKKAYQTPAGRKEIRELVQKYKEYKQKNPNKSPHTFFLR